MRAPCGRVSIDAIWNLFVKKTYVLKQRNEETSLATFTTVCSFRYQNIINMRTTKWEAQTKIWKTLPRLPMLRFRASWMCLNWTILFYFLPVGARTLSNLALCSLVPIWSQGLFLTGEGSGDHKVTWWMCFWRKLSLQNVVIATRGAVHCLYNVGLLDKFSFAASLSSIIGCPAPRCRCN